MKRYSIRYLQENLVTCYESRLIAINRKPKNLNLTFAYLLVPAKHNLLHIRVKIIFSLIFLFSRTSS